MTPATFRALREQLGYTREQLAGVLNVSVRTIKRWEQPNGKEPPAGVVDEVLRLKDKQDFVVSQSLEVFAQAKEQAGTEPKCVNISYFQDQAQFDVFGRDEGLFNVANANSRAAALALEVLEGCEVEFNYPNEE